MIFAQLTEPSGDICPLLALIVILFFVGRKMVEEKPGLRRAGMCLAAAIFVACWLMQLVNLRDPASGGDSSPHGLDTRANDFGGLVKPAVRMQDRMILNWKADAPSPVNAAFTALSVGGIALGAAWIVLALLAFIYSQTIGAAWTKLRDCTAALSRRRDDRRAQRARDRDALRAQREYERQAPERARAQRAAEEQSRRVADAHRRREAARAACELVYSLYFADISTRLPREAFGDFLSKHLSDAHEPEYVEEQSRKLQQLILKLAEKSGAGADNADIVAATAEHQKKRKKIEESDIDPGVKKIILPLLDAQFYDRIQRISEQQ